MRRKIMGLTIHYTFSVKEDISAGVVRELVQRTAHYARKIGCAEVSEPLRVRRNQDIAPLFFRVGKPKDQFYATAAPERGWLVRVSPGAGCETAKFGLCEYPSRILYGDRQVSTGLKVGWQFRSF